MIRYRLTEKWGFVCNNLAATRAERNSYPQVLIKAALVLTTTAPYFSNLSPPYSQYLVLKRAMMSSWGSAVVDGYAEKVRAAAY
jgi:hypothetical protein